jgi:hypothetical protein
MGHFILDKAVRGQRIISRARVNIDIALCHAAGAIAELQNSPVSAPSVARSRALLLPPWESAIVFYKGTIFSFRCTGVSYTGTHL